VLLTYHLYSSDGGRTDIQATSDADAIATAGARTEDYRPAELWCRNRLVRRWDGDDLPLFNWPSTPRA